MTEKDKDKRMNELMEISTKLGKATNPLLQMKMFLKEHGDFIASIHAQGYEEGFHAGKKAWVNENQN